MSCPDRNLAVFHHYRHYEDLRLLPSVCEKIIIQQTLIKKDKKKLISKTLPSADDIKNLNININKYRIGFILKAQYGGGDNIYNRNFYFKWTKGSFFLYKIVGTHVKPNFTKSIITIKNILPFINIRDFNIQYFLENTP